MTAIQDNKANDEMLSADMARFFSDPMGWVMYAYPWASDPTIQVCKLREPWRSKYGCEYGPDQWACEFLDHLGEQIRERGFRISNPVPVEPIREATVSGHGIGKSALVGWLTGFILSTRPFARGAVTAGSWDQLETKTFAQIAFWNKKAINGYWFDVSTSALWIRHKQHRDSWRCDGYSCKEENSDSFQGQHSVISTSFYIFDEASAVPDKIWEVAWGGLTDGEPMIFVFGNGTRNTGEFRECFRRNKHRWHTREIDSRSVQITNKVEIQRLIEDYGIDSDRVKVRVRGMFPSLSSRQFFSTADVDAAFGRVLRPEEYNFAPKILTLDNAWTGDDEGVIGLRQGLAFQILTAFARNDNDIWVANRLAHLEDEHHVDAVFIDAGYGTGVYSAGKTLGREWMLVWFAGQSNDPGCLNKRAEMMNSTKRWLKEGGAIPPDNGLYYELLAPETVPRLDGKIQIESKEDMKKRGLTSGNRLDALNLSFAYPVQTKTDIEQMQEQYQTQESLDEYDPLKAMGFR